MMRAIIMIRKEAIIGDRSIAPKRANCRIGARMGSVMSIINDAMGLRGSTDVQERITRMKMAPTSTQDTISIRLATLSIALTS